MSAFVRAISVLTFLFALGSHVERYGGWYFFLIFLATGIWEVAEFLNRDQLLEEYKASLVCPTHGKLTVPMIASGKVVYPCPECKPTGTH
jgi:hypothetical protein